ncbi:hypothetical protein [Alicyclobacillus sp. SO9]|uniref:hypothetical protein n=1 Tax=Alicyclobacillus sp. SO9 TaxID=2665646 RepID=UPI0018E7C8B2|nr:hypothetical protein [Alicyclobacillus sp. SO9]QQE81548.1 hypothetical protein GI364_24930 [Alicyclobacillus sp. SO9]
MGGYGSGYRGNSRRTTGECLSIDVNRFNRANVLQDGIGFVWGWKAPRTPKLTVTVSGDELTLEYDTHIRGVKESVKETVAISHTICNYGGGRPWFKCPGCFSRVGKLYLHDGAFRCRECHNLTYQSCQATHDPTRETMEGVKRIRRKMGAEGDMIYPNAPTPCRPTGMHTSKYNRLRQQLMQAEQTYQDAFTNGAERILGIS